MSGPYKGGFYRDDDPEDDFCPSVMPRTNPDGRFVCHLPFGHEGWHQCPLSDGGVATWRDEPSPAVSLPGDKR